jgi:phosphopantetheine adenylyltransferase
MGARLESVEDRELIEEAMDWERHLMVGFISEKVARTVSQLFAEASKRRYEYVTKRIKESLSDDDVAMLVIREGHAIQFPTDVEVFMVAPPALDDIRRWLRDRQEKADLEAAASETEAPNPEAKPE